MTISSQIIEVLNDICKKFGIVIDWSQENILPYLQELAGKYISWEIATSVAWLIGAAIIIVVSIILLVVDIKCFGFCGMSVVSMVLWIAALVVVVEQINDILTCMYFPEKQIVEYVKYLMQLKG